MKAGKYVKKKLSKWTECVQKESLQNTKNMIILWGKKCNNGNIEIRIPLLHF